MKKASPLLERRICGGFGRVAVVAIFARISCAASRRGPGWFLHHHGIAGTAQDAETKAANWDKTTQWSLPKAETLGLFVPGLFGYKMDTPKDMMPALQDAYKGGNYWGGVGRDPAIDRYFDSGRQGAQPPGFMRFGGGGKYLGILVALLAPILPSHNRCGGKIPPSLERKKIHLVLGNHNHLHIVAVVGALCAVLLQNVLRAAVCLHHPQPGQIPLNTFVGDRDSVRLRRPRLEPASSGCSCRQSKFIFHAVDKLVGEDPLASTAEWTVACSIAVVGSVLAWLVYSAQQPGLAKFLQTVGFDGSMVRDIAAFSVGQAGWFILFFAASVALCILIIAGVFAGFYVRKLGGFLLGALLVVDLGRANLPWIIHWDYTQKYEVGSLNPIEDFMRDKPYEHRVAILPFDTQSQMRDYDYLFGGLGIYRIEWAQQHFPYYNIQSLDIVQMSRTGQFEGLSRNTFTARGGRTPALRASLGTHEHALFAWRGGILGCVERAA